MTRAGQQRELFFDHQLRGYLDQHVSRMHAAISREEDEHLFTVDADEWAESLAHHFAVLCPILAGEVWQSEWRETTMDVRGDYTRDFGPHREDLAMRYPAYSTVVHARYEGEGQVFYLRPGSFSTIWPVGWVTDDAVCHEIVWPRDAESPVDSMGQKFIDQVERYLSWAHNDVESHNASLKPKALGWIAERRAAVEKRSAQQAASKFPVRTSRSVPTMKIADVLIRRPAPRLPSNRADGKAPTLEPALEAMVYEHILTVMRDTLRSMETRGPRMSGREEEDRRDEVLTTLGTHYPEVTAETMNQHGHTDILIKHEGRNLFIAECKFWSGVRGFAATVDQLFRYTGWRDSKLAIVVFVREHGIEKIIEKGRAALAEHPQFVSWERATDKAELRAVVSYPHEQDRRAELNIFFVHTPE